MSVAPATLLDLQAYWVSQGGVSLGIVGNAVHCKGYHLGRDRIYGSCACRPKNICVPGLGAADYSVQTARDRAGLSNAASAIDLGRLGGSLSNLYAFSRWLVERCRTNQPGTADIREVICSPDGTTVLRWDRERGHASAPRPGEADESHLTHTHISYYRDSEDRDKRPVFAAYFAEGGTVGDFVVHEPDVESRRTGKVKRGTPFFSDWALTNKRGTFSADATVQIFGHRGNAHAVQVRTAQGWADGTTRPTMVYVAKSAVSDVTTSPWPPADATHTVTLQIDGVEKFRTEV